MLVVTILRFPFDMNMRDRITSIDPFVVVLAGLGAPAPFQPRLPGGVRNLCTGIGYYWRRVALQRPSYEKPLAPVEGFLDRCKARVRDIQNEFRLI
jgi:hypothetical protein